MIPTDSNVKSGSGWIHRVHPKELGMRNLILIVGLSLEVWFPAGLPAQNRAPNRLRAGAAKVDITPKESDLKISTDSIRDQLFARAIVIDDGMTCAALVGLDLGGAANQIVDDATARASQATGCPAENFIISATHTHSSNT